MAHQKTPIRANNVELAPVAGLDKFTRIGYADESNWNLRQYRTIALVTAERPTAEVVTDKVARAIEEARLSEFAWNKLRSHDALLAANAMTDIAVDAACSGGFRVDVIIWDTLDSRHAVEGRDDLANFERMYYHLIKTTIEKKWPKASWMIRPDERTDMDWHDLEQCLMYPSRKYKNSQSLVLDKQFQGISMPLRICDIASSHPLVQVADIFAGLASFSWNEHSKYASWKSQHSEQFYMLSNQFPQELQQNTAGIKCKSQALQHFEKIYLPRLRGRDRKEFEKRRRGLVTLDPNMPINFWFYIPQRNYDKAPRRR